MVTIILEFGGQMKHFAPIYMEIIINNIDEFCK